MFPSAKSLHLLNPPKGGDSTSSLGSVFQCLTSLSMNNFFLISSLNLPWHNLRPFSLVLSLVICEKRLTPTWFQHPFSCRDQKDLLWASFSPQGNVFLSWHLHSGSTLPGISFSHVENNSNKDHPKFILFLSKAWHLWSVGCKRGLTVLPTSQPLFNYFPWTLWLLLVEFERFGLLW